MREIQKALTEAKKAYADFVRGVGDDMGCDGTGQIATQLRLQVEALEADLADARAEALAKKGGR